MPYKGHIEKGVVVLDESVHLKDGTEVRVEVVQPDALARGGTPLRGKPYRYDDPFAPAISDDDAR